MNPRQIERRQLTIPSTGTMRAAVADRDATYDGVFCYGVVTTGVVCKPSCASRAAKPENLRFFPDVESATRAGYRPCRKCRPESTPSRLDDMIRIARHIATHADEKLTLADLSKMANLSPSQFQKSFKATFGASPREIQDACRLDRFKTALKQADSVTDAIFSAGFGSTSRVYGEAARSMGMTPAAYRAGGAGERVFYAFRESALGPLLMAATARGVCFAQFGEDRDSLLAQLAAEFPEAELSESPGSDGTELDQWIRALDAHLAEQAPRPDVPLDLRGTSFQLKVWRFLLSVQEGDVLSYGELAEKIGQPTAVRAVASACAANKVGVLVPCHRVLRGDGHLGGYRWGVERKRVLLDNERAMRASS